MDIDLVGSGWAFPIRTGEDDRIVRSSSASSVTDADPIEASIRLILETAPGERVMRPDFGCRLHELVFAVNNATTAGRAAQAVTEALIRWEPRIDLLRIEVPPDSRNASVLRIGIMYRVRGADNVSNLVYPFYLERGMP